MKMRRSILLTVIGLFALCLGLKAEVYSGACGDSIAWSLDTETGVLVIEGKGEITGRETYNHETKEWEQPKTWLQYKEKISSARIAEGVTCIGYEAFKDCSNLVSVSIPNSVTRIEFSAFANCSKLVSISLPESVKRIDSWAFEGCFNLKSINIPEALTKLSKYAFQRCDKLEYEIVDGIKYLGNWAIEPEGYRKTYSIREGTVGLSDNLMSSTSLLLSIELPNSLAFIGESAFEGCSDLKSIMIPGNVVSIGKGAFKDCSALESIVVPENVTYIGESVLENCSGLVSIEVSEDNPVYDSRENCNAIIHTVSNDLIAGCSSTLIPDGVQIINLGAFNGAKGLRSVVIPASVTSIKTSAFYNCPALASISVAEGNTVYDSRQNCNAIIHTTSNELVAGCASTVIPEGVKSIGMGAFYGCVQLVSAEMPNSVKAIGEGAFFGCTNLMSVKLPDSISVIPTGAFAHCASLTSVKLPQGLETISQNSFYGCSNLKSIVVPKNVTQLAATSFVSCPELTSLVVEEGNPKYDSRDNCNGVIETETNTLVWMCNSTKIPSTVVTIAKDAFFDGTLYTSTSSEGGEILMRFGRAEYVKNMVSLASTPPSVSGNIYDSYTIYVPKESVEEYSKVAPWNKWTIHGFTQKKTKDGREKLVVDALQVKPGVYRQTQYKRGDQPVEDYPFEVYKKVLGTDTIDVNDDIKKIVLKAVQMEVYVAEGQNNIKVPCFLITNPQLNVIEAGKKGFTNRWVCNSYSHKTIKHGTIVNEYYAKKYKPSTEYKEIEKVFKTKPNKKNAYLGVWKMKSNLNTTYYKIYGENYRVSMHIRRNDAQGSIETVEYLKDKTTIEGGNPCDIRWTSPDSYTLFYQWNGNVIGETWERSSMEELGEDFRKVVMDRKQ